MMIIEFLIWPILIIGGIGFFVARWRKKEGKHVDEKNWHLQIAFSKEDLVSQFFYLLALFFLGVALIALNRDLGSPISWQTIILITSVIGIFSAYYFKSFYVLPFSIIGIAIWWASKAVFWMDGKDIKEACLFTVLSLFTILLYLIGRAHEKEIKFKRYSLVYTIIGLFSITGILFFLSSKNGLSMIHEITNGSSIFSSWQIVFSLVAIVIILFLTMLYVINKKLISIPEILSLVFLSILFIIFVIIPEQNIFEANNSGNYYYHTKEFTNTGIIWAFFLNILIFLEILWVIFSGYIKKEKWIINLGVLFMFFLIIIKYFDWFFTFFDKSIFFISAGIMLFLVGWFMEKGRKYMISEIQKEAESAN